MASSERSGRIAFERPIVYRQYPGACLHEGSHGTYFEFWTGSNGHRYNYHLKLDLPADYPHSKPDLILESPRRLPLLDGSRVIGDPETVLDFHVYGMAVDGGLDICFRKEWDASMNAPLVFFWGMIWVAGLDNYFATGETIGEYIDRLKKKLEEL
ncbi:MAG: hypothetical protein ACYTEK_15885 [Planctomycetota bacterium]|jgi:hypothetical protein